MTIGRPEDKFDDVDGEKRQSGELPAGPPPDESATGGPRSFSSPLSGENPPLTQSLDIPPPLDPSQPLPPMPSGVDTLGFASIIVSLMSLPVAGCCGMLCMPVGFVGFLGAIAGGVLGVMGIMKARREDRQSIPSVIGLILAILTGLMVILYIGFVIVALIASEM